MFIHFQFFLKTPKIEENFAGIRRVSATCCSQSIRTSRTFTRSAAQNPLFRRSAAPKIQSRIWAHRDLKQHKSKRIAAATEENHSSRRFQFLAGLIHFVQFLHIPPQGFNFSASQQRYRSLSHRRPLRPTEERQQLHPHENRESRSNLFSSKNFARLIKVISGSNTPVLFAIKSSEEAFTDSIAQCKRGFQKEHSDSLPFSDSPSCKIFYLTSVFTQEKWKSAQGYIQ